MPNQNNYFSTQLPQQFSIQVDYTKGCEIIISDNLSFSNEWNTHDGLNICLIQWANHEFKNNPLAQEKLKEIKQSEKVKLGYCSIADYGYMHVIAVGLNHILSLIEAMGYKVLCSKNQQTKMVDTLSFSRMPS